MKLHPEPFNDSTIQQFNQSTIQLSPATDLHGEMKKEKGKMKKERGERPPVPRYMPMNRDYSATGFSPQSLKRQYGKEPPFEGGNGG